MTEYAPLHSGEFVIPATWGPSKHHPDHAALQQVIDDRHKKLIQQIEDPT